jgi:hypothetical protein
LLKRNIPSEVALAELLAKEFRNLVPPNENAFEPVSDMIYPIIDYLDSVSLETSNSSTKSRTVGNLIQPFYWRDLIKDTLPVDSDGLIMVFDTQCKKQPFTYRIE